MPRPSNPLGTLARRSRTHEDIERVKEEAARETTIRFNMNMPRSLHQQLRQEAFERGCDMKDILMELLEARYRK